MLSGQRSAWRRRGRNSRAVRIAVPLAIPMAMGLTLGVILAVSGGHITKINQSAMGAAASPSVGASGAAVAAVTATPTTTAAAAAAVPPAPSNASGQTAFRQLGDLATVPVDGAGNAINLNQTAAQAAASMNCTLTVPAKPLSAPGLATPWQLGDGCSMLNAATEGAFVEATILAPNGQVQVYNPLVITAGTTAAANPVAPTIARGSQVIIDVGFNGTNLVLQGPGVRQGRCVDALGQSVIGQVSACNAVNFYNLANFEIARGTLTVPLAGTSADGQPCLTTRSFAVVDQDQSDNVITSYLIDANGQTAQNTAANATANPTATTLVNGSDDKLLAAFLDPATGCTDFHATDPTDPTGAAGSQALNELSARVNQQGTIAVVPPNDEMTLVNGAFSIPKTNVYRSLVDQPMLPANTNATQVAADYCQNLVNIQPARNLLDMGREAGGSPVAAVGNSLATFMGNRLAMSFVNLGCANFGLANPATVTLDGNMIATAVTYNTGQQAAKLPTAATPTPTATATVGTGGPGGGTTGPPARQHRVGHRFDNPSRM
jgi:hypothetical protein